MYTANSVSSAAISDLPRTSAVQDHSMRCSCPISAFSRGVSLPTHSLASVVHRGARRSVGDIEIRAAVCSLEHALPVDAPVSAHISEVIGCREHSCVIRHRASMATSFQLSLLAGYELLASITEVQKLLCGLDGTPSSHSCAKGPEVLPMALAGALTRTTRAVAVPLPVFRCNGLEHRDDCRCVGYLEKSHVVLNHTLKPMLPLVEWPRISILNERLAYEVIAHGPIDVLQQRRPMWP
jgi:hypothetical protein